MLAQEVLHMCGTISCEHPWKVMLDLNFYTEPENTEKEEQVAPERLCAGALCAIKQFPTEDWVLSLPLKTDLQLPLLRPLN
ncbi:hypothetical protein GH733_003239, partial [Mirounga leonina]